MAELALQCSVLQPTDSHVYLFEAFSGNSVCYKAICGCIIRLRWGRRFLVIHFLKCLACEDGFAKVYDEGAEFGLC